MNQEIKIRIQCAIAGIFFGIEITILAFLIFNGG